MTVILDHQFTGTGTFAGDAAFTNLAGTAPTYADAGDGQTGLLFPSGAQSLVHAASIGTLAGDVFLDLVIDLSADPGGAAEIAQLRGSSKVCAVAVTSSGQLQVQGSANSTGANGVPDGKFRVVLAREAAGTARLYIYTDDTGTTLLQTLSVACSTADITSVRLGWSGSGSTVSGTVSWPLLTTTLAETGPRTYGPPPSTTLFERSYNDLPTLSTFTGDAIQQLIAGAAPTVVRSAVAKGLRFDGGAQSIVQHEYAAPEPVVVISRVIEVGPGTPVTGEILQVRESTSQRGPAVAITNDRKLRLIRLSGTTGVSAATTTATIPTGRFRYTLVVNQNSLSLTMYPDETSTTPVEVALTSTTSDPIDVLQVREGIIPGVGIGDVTVTTFHPLDDSTSDPGPRSYPALPTEAPQALVAAVPTVDPWATVELLGSDIEESNPIAARSWAPAPGNPVVLDPGSGASRTFAAPASLDEETYDFVYTVTDDQALEDTATVTVTVRPATYARKDPVDGWVPTQRTVAQLVAVQ
ncbi:PKD domain-containing protein [Thalassiella azotivora]